jgi:hypothetical protein
VEIGLQHASSPFISLHRCPSLRAPFRPSISCARHRALTDNQQPRSPPQSHFASLGQSIGLAAAAHGRTDEFPSTLWHSIRYRHLISCRALNNSQSLMPSRIAPHLRAATRHLPTPAFRLIQDPTVSHARPHHQHPRSRLSPSRATHQAKAKNPEFHECYASPPSAKQGETPCFKDFSICVAPYPNTMRPKGERS